MWEEKLVRQGWSKVAAKALVKNWAPSTMNTYNGAVEKLRQFCLEEDTSFPEVSTASLANYLCHLAQKSDRPKSVMNTCLAAVTCMTQALKLKDPVTEDILKLSTALVKSHTTKPMQKSQVMPVRPFIDLFLSWPGNWCLTIEDLRLKCLTLLALSIMLRPSDVAPRSKVYNSSKETYEDLVLSVDQLKFLSDGSAKITLFGIKNDYSREGFPVEV